MKPSYLALLLAVAGAAAAGGWLLARHDTPGHVHPGAAEAVPADAAKERTVLYYQSPMHPWIKSPKPGKCTICGMDLVPVYEGDKGFDVAEGLVTLTPGGITVTHVATTPVARRPLQRTLRVAGVIDDNDTRHRRLSAYVDGRIEELFINYVGAEVKEGEPLASLHSPMLLTLEREYLAVYRQTTNTAIPPREELARMLSAAEQRLLQMGLSKPQIAKLASRPDEEHMIEILSPMSGTVVSREIYAGQYVKEGDKLFELADFSTMWFRFDAYERDLAWLRTGQKVRITTPSLPGRVLEAPITFIDPNLNEATRSTKVRVDLPNPLIEEGGMKRREILHRVYADGVVEITLPEVLTLPRSAVLNAGGTPVAYVDQGGGAYQQRKLRLGRAGDEVWEVLDGVREGERVVSTGNLLLDAQAQLNSSVASAPAPGAPAEAPARATPAQEQAARAFLEAATRVADALAADSLDRYNQEIPKIPAAIAGLGTPFDGASGWTRIIEDLQRSAAQLDKASSLVDARKAFHPFSAASVELAKLARRATPLESVRIFQCPMTGRAFPGAPKVGAWIQSGSTARNPFFGAEMLDCGTELKP